MSFLGRFRILTKILAIVLFLSAIAAAVAYLGVASVKSVADAGVTMNRASDAAVLTVRATASVIALNRAEYSLVADPRPDNKRAARKMVDEEMQQLKTRFDGMNEIMSKTRADALARIQAAYQAYQRDLETTFAKAEAVRDVTATPEMEALRTSAKSSLVAAETLRGELRTLLGALDKRVNDLGDEQAAEYQRALDLIVILSIVGILGGMALAFVIGRYGISEPIRHMVVVLQKLAAGNYEAEIVGVDRKDEVGEVAKTALVFRENGLSKQRLELDQAEETSRNIAEKRETMHRLASSFEQAVGGIVGTVSAASTELQASAETLSASAEETTHQSVAVSAAAEEASSNVNTVAAAAEQLARSVEEIGRQVEQSSQLSSRAVTDAASTNEKVQHLAQAAQRIGAVTNLINDIASQTNLLALNATIEAARAGAAGKGFAVVASEVKQLAEQTSKATAEISTQINEIQNATGSSVDAIRSIGETIRSMNGISEAIATAVEEQLTATGEIARNVQQASTGTMEVSRNITGVSRAAEETTVAATQVLSSAGELSRQSERLHQELDRFLGEIRSA